MHLSRALLHLGLCAGLLLQAGCVTDEPTRNSESPFAKAPDPNEGPPAEPVARPWTQAFMQPAGLIAREVRIEGPPGLLEHVAARAEPIFHEREVKTVSEGLLQTYSQSDPRNPVEVRAWLDALEIVATERLSILERPGGRTLSVRATGDAWWRAVEGTEERRGQTLELKGQLAD